MILCQAGVINTVIYFIFNRSTCLLRRPTYSGN